MATWVGSRNCITLTLVILILACLPSQSFGVKVIENKGSLNKTSYEFENAEANEVMQLEAPEIDDGALIQTPMSEIDKVEHHPHTIMDKPTKFDLDTTGMIHTDTKNLHEAEAGRLGNLSRNAQVNTMNRMDESEECNGGITMACFQESLGELFDDMSNVDTINITGLVQIIKINVTDTYKDVQDYSQKTDILDKVHRFAKSHALRIRIPEGIASRQSRTFFGSKFEVLRALNSFAARDMVTAYSNWSLDRLGIYCCWSINCW